MIEIIFNWHHVFVYFSFAMITVGLIAFTV